MAKSSSRKTLKGLFSRSGGASQDAAPPPVVDKDVDKNEGDKKRFKFLPKFKMKSRSGSASEKPTNENQQVLSAVDLSNTAEDGEAWTDNIVSNNKRSSLYGTAPRSKGKDLSYSEMDLRKPKRFATFTFGLRKKKKKDEENISKSSLILTSPGIKEQEETPPDLDQMELDQDNMKMLSRSQPELDSPKFDIPSPPPVATNRSESYFTLLNQSQSSVNINSQPEAEKPLTDGSNLIDVHEEPQKAPIATIPELQLDNPDSSEDKENIPVCDSNPSSTATRTETTSAVDNQTVPVLAASQPPIMPDSSDHKAGAVVSTSSGLSYTDIQQSDTKTDTSLTEFARDTLSHHQPDAPETADSTTPNGKPCLASVDATVTESTPVPHTDNSASLPREVSFSRTERSTPETAKSVTSTSAVSSEKSARPVSQDSVYGALYESLFPQSFTSEVMSSLSHRRPQIHTEIRHLNTKVEPVMIKTLNERHTETNLIYSRMSHDSAAGGYTAVNAALSGRKVIISNDSSTFNSYQTNTASETRRDADIYRYLPSSHLSGSQSVDNSNIPYSELTHPISEAKSDHFSLIQDTARSAPVAPNPAPPISNYVTSQGTDTQVTDSVRRVILVKELVTDEASSTDTVCASTAPEKISTEKDLEIKLETTRGFSAASGQMDGYDGPLSPTYLSVGSDDGSAMEIYYSAEEDNAEESADEEMYTMDEREEICVVDRVKEVVELREELPQQGNETSKRDERESRVVIIKMLSEEDTMSSEDKREDVNSRTEAQQQLKGQSSEAQVQETGTSEFLSDAKSLEREVATTAFLQVKEDGQEERKEERKEELPATPVQQVNAVMVCDFAPPSSELLGPGEGSQGNWTEELEKEDHPNGEKLLPCQEIQYLTYKDIRSSECTQAAYSSTREEDMITSDIREAEEQVSLTVEADKSGEPSKESPESSSNAATSAVTDTSGELEVATGTLTRSVKLQSDATEIEHNRAPQSSEWVDTITLSAGRTRKEQQQVAVELPAPNEDAQRPDTESADTHSERHEHPAEAPIDLNQGSLTTSRTAAPEVFASENQPTEADQESVDNMNSGYSSLSTKLTIRNSTPPKEDESKRFRKVSLVSEGGTAEDSQDTVDTSNTSTAVTEVNGADVTSDYRWKNRFEGVSQYKQYTTEDSSLSDSLSYRMSDTYSSTSSLSSSLAPPEATAYKYLGNAFSSSSSPYTEEHITLGKRLNDSTEVYLSRESEPAAEQKDEWRSHLAEQEEPAAPAGEREPRREGEAKRIKSRWELELLPESGLPSAQQTSYDNTDSFKEEDDDSSRFTGVFQATLVELVSDPAAPPSTPPASPDIDSPNQFDMDSLVDTLKNMGPSMRPRGIGARAPAPSLISSLPPIVEDAPSPITSDVPDSSSPTKKMEATTKAEATINKPAPEPLNGLYTLPADLGLKRNTPRDTRSPLELMKYNQQDQQPGTRGAPPSPLRASTTNSIVMRTSPSEELKSPLLNGNGAFPLPAAGSRLDNSSIFGSYRSSSIDQTSDRQAHRPLFRTGSLPETGLSNERLSVGAKELELGTGMDAAGSRFERFSFLLNSSSSSSGSLTGTEDPNSRMSRPPPQLGIGSPPASNSPTRLLSPTGSIDLHRSFVTTEAPLSVFGQTQGIGMGVGNGGPGTPILQRSFSGDGTMGIQQNSLFNSVHGGSQFQSQEREPERNLALKYRAFPDAYLTKEKEHGKLNPRPGKMFIFDRPGMCGQRIEVRSDVIDATPWELEETISIRVVRGGWVLYEKPNFKGEKFALDEGDIELTCPFSPPEEQLQNGQTEGEAQNGEQNGNTSDVQTENKPARRFIIGSIRRAVRDYSVPEISLFPEENAEGKKVIFRDTSEDARIFGFPIKANSIIINAGLWLVYAHPFFQGVPRVLEVGGYSNPAAWGVEKPYVGSLHPLKVGEPRVENMSEPKMVIYDKPYFSGKSRTITSTMRDFMTRTDRQQSVFMYSVGSLKVLGGIWVGYEKEGFRGHQYLLEEGEYHDWRVWGGCDAELRSVRVIKADLTDPLMVMFEQPEEDGVEGENTFEVTEAIPDVELFEYKTSTRSIHVLSGAWVAYSHVDFSGNQYILEKGFYNNCGDWGSQDNRICSVQPILMAPSDTKIRNEVILYSEPDFQGECHFIDRNQEAVSEKLLTKSCRVSGGSWVVYADKKYSGNMFVLSEGDYPNLTSMGCPPGFTLRSIKAVPMTLSIPSISLFGLECLEGREITTDTEIHSMVEEGFNNHILSLRVNSGCWVVCEHSNYRGRQFLLEPIEITNWPKFSSLQTVGSMFPVRQKRCFFRIKNKERGHFMSVQGGVEEMKTGRVVVTPEVEPMSDIWFYQDGFIKNKLSQNMSLQVMGNVEPGAKVVLWTETRQPIQNWTAQMSGLITSLTFPGMVLDVKGGKTYDKDHVVILPENDERPSQQWEIQLL